MVDETGKMVMYQNPRESLYRCIDEIEAVLGLRGGPEDAERALKQLEETLKSKSTV